MGVMDAVMSLDQLVDESDPDVDFPNSFHAFQTAEGIRREHPDNGTMVSRARERGGERRERERESERERERERETDRDRDRD